jgi:hypothetical protein
MHSPRLRQFCLQGLAAGVGWFGRLGEREREREREREIERERERGRERDRERERERERESQVNSCWFDFVFELSCRVVIIVFPTHPCRQSLVSDSGLCASLKVGGPGEFVPQEFRDSKLIGSLVALHAQPSWGCAFDHYKFKNLCEELWYP